MPLTRTEKENIVGELSKHIKESRVAILGGYTKVPFKKIQELRASLKAVNISNKTAKKTLLNIALREHGLAADELFEGDNSVMLTLGSGDEVTHAKTIFDFSKKLEGFNVLGGFIDNVFYSKDRILALAKLPPKQVILGQLAYAVAYPMTGLVGALQGNLRNLVCVLDNVRRSKE